MLLRNATVVAVAFAPVARAQNLPTPVEERTQWSTWFDRLDSLQKLQQGWDSYSAPPPSPDAIAQARAFLERLREVRFPPDRLAPAVVGGVGVTFKQEGLKVYVEFSNKGSVHALFSDGLTDPTVSKIRPDRRGYSELISRIKTYLYE